MNNALIKQINDFIQKQSESLWFRNPEGKLIERKIISGKGRKLKPYLKVGGKLYPREVAERKKAGGIYRIPGTPKSEKLPKL